MNQGSGIYSGWVMHRRLKPRRHRFRYRAWWLLLDLAELPRLADRLRWFSCGRFNLFSFYESDYGHGAEPLRKQIEHHLDDAGIAWDRGAIRLLCMPRVLGYAFNPLSVYFCHWRDGTIAATVYEVHNTFGERHSYVIEATAARDEVIRQQSAKRFYVSPFMGMDVSYEFRATQPEEAISIGISAADASGPVMHAAMQGHRKRLNDAQLLRLLITHPLVTLKVIGAIHWEALRLWGKRLQLQTHTSPVLPPVTAVAARKPAYTRAKSSHA
jgi:uncharacterized protein